MKYPRKQQIANKLLCRAYKHKCIQAPGLQDKQVSELVSINNVECWDWSKLENRMLV